MGALMAGMMPKKQKEEEDEVAMDPEKARQLDEVREKIARLTGELAAAKAELGELLSR